MDLRLWTYSFSDAWNALSNFPFPMKLEEPEEDESADERFLACFPLVGAMWGLGGAMVAWLIATLMPLSLASAALSAIIIVVSWEFLSAGGNVSGLAGYLSDVLGRRGIRAEGSGGSLDFDVSGMTLFISLYLLKIVCVGAVVYNGRYSWLVVALALGGLIRSRLAADDSSGKALIPVEEPETAAKTTWFAAAAIVVVAGFHYLPAALLALLLAWGTVAVLARTARSEPGETPDATIDALGAAADMVFLVAGAALLSGIADG